MPFDKAFDDVYTFGIKQTCEELNTYCERVDEQIFHERILDRIYNQIAKSDILVADMTERNANVFYEVGYAHGLGKNVILLTQNADDIPFDLKHFPHIVYGGQIKNLREQLTTRLEWFLNQDQNEIQNFEFGLRFLVDGETIESNKVIPIPQEFIDQYGNSFDLRLDIYNDLNKVYRTKFKVGIEFSREFHKLITGSEELSPSKDRIIIASKEQMNIYPHAYKSINFTGEVKRSKDGEPIIIDAILKIFTNLELKEIPFKLSVPTRTNDFNW